LYKELESLLIVWFRYSKEAMLIATSRTDIAANKRINLRVTLTSEKPATVILSPHET